ncbi:unnamed protein product [Effrenium voratum]|uniref:Uncharacterized protein n=1 Tax=Effrenium voratum TaxID=2562239 RepID=A0AA36ITD5_9DINO|nr:unnamed protein product [Effrenium voratum]
MAPKQIVVGGGYEQNELSPEMLQLIAQVEGMTLDEVNALDTEFQVELQAVQMRTSFLNERRAQNAQQQAQAHAKAKAVAKAQAKADALAIKKTGSTTVVICSIPSMSVYSINLEKAKTVGRMKSKFVRRSALYPTYGKKGGMKKDDLLIVDDAGTVLPPRAFIYNTSALLGANPRVVAVERANFDPETFQFPDFDRRTDVPIDEEDDEVDDEESDDED